MHVLLRCFRAARQSADAGVSLVEMVVTCALAALMVGLAGTFAVQVMDNTQDEVDRGDSTASARIAAEYLSRSVRTAVSLSPSTSPFTTYTATDVTFYALVDTTVAAGQAADVPRQVRIWVDTSTNPSTLRQRTWTPTGGTAAAPVYGAPVDRVLARGVVNNASSPLFTLQQTSDPATAIPVGSAASALLAATFVDIEVRQQVKRTSATTDAASVSSIVRLPNLLD